MDIGCTQVVASNSSISGFLINGNPNPNKLWALVSYATLLKSQASDTGPLNLTMKFTSLLAKNNSFVIVSFPSSYWIPTTTDLICFWGAYAAANCLAITNGFQIFTPLETDISANVDITLYINTNRLANNGFIFPATNNYTVTATSKSGFTVSKILSGNGACTWD